MRIQQIHTQPPYEVWIGNDILSKLPAQKGSCALVTDDIVDRLYGEKVTELFRSRGIPVKKYVFPHGESGKSGENYLKLLRFLSPLTRSDFLVALGGGVVGDLTGFAAATYLRGISYLQIPTTILAQVDSSVGGKTAINLPEGKNLVGAFHQPSFVLCDTALLDSLPMEQIKAGCGEIIKYALGFDADLFAQLEAEGMDFDREQVIARCIAIKDALVSRDTKDHGCRQLLNLGHTVGHAIEKCSGFTLPHGIGVAMGMGVVTRAAVANHVCESVVLLRLEALLAQFGLSAVSPYPMEQLIPAMLEDKKRMGDTINLILPVSIGHCAVTPMPVADAIEFIRKGIL